MDEIAAQKPPRRASTFTEGISSNEPADALHRCSITFKANDFPLPASESTAVDSVPSPTPQAKRPDIILPSQIPLLRGGRKQREDDGQYTAFYIDPSISHPHLAKAARWVRAWHQQNPGALYGFRDNFKALPVKAADCILRGPKYSTQQFDYGRLLARTLDGKPAWWCRNCHLVIFDGISTGENGGPLGFHTRTSRGLALSRKHLPKEVVEFQLTCSHCLYILGKRAWCFEARVAEGKVCKKCEERCWTLRQPMNVEIEDRKSPSDL